jgi:hypothetical protein
LSRSKDQDRVWWKVGLSEKSADDIISDLEIQKKRQQSYKLENEWINKAKSIMDGFHEVPNPDVNSLTVSAMDVLKSESEGRVRYFIAFKPSVLDGYKEYEEILEPDALKLSAYLMQQPKVA